MGKENEGQGDIVSIVFSYSARDLIRACALYTGTKYTRPDISTHKYLPPG